MYLRCYSEHSKPHPQEQVELSDQIQKFENIHER